MALGRLRTGSASTPAGVLLPGGETLPTDDSKPPMVFESAHCLLSRDICTLSEGATTWRCLYYPSGWCRVEIKSMTSTNFPE